MSEGLLKLLIVDDEHLVRCLLRNCINWNEIGYEIVGEAASGYEALELVERFNPDVIFTDINMPFMDGLEFGRLVYERDASVKIIILTGYEEFEYAKRSIKIGISDFLLKPINDDEIRKAAISMKVKIEAERNHRAEYNRIKKQLEENMPYLRERLLNEIIQNGFDSEDIQTRMDYFNIRISEDYVQAAAIEATPCETENVFNEEDRLFVKMQCHELVNKYFRDDGSAIHVFFDNSQNIIVLTDEKALDLAECLEDLRTMLINRLKCYICIGIGTPYAHRSRIKLSYKEAIHALNYKTIVGKNQIINYSDIIFSNSNQVDFQNAAFDSMAFYLKACMRKKAFELIEGAFCAGGLNGGILPIDSIRVLASNIVSIILNVITEMEINLSDILSEGISQPFEEIFKIDTLPEMKRYLTHLTGDAIQAIQNKQNRKMHQVIEQAMDHIMQNLSDPGLSLSKIAKTYFVNMSYLSRIFKQETGHTFMEYLSRARMEKAVRLLKETNLKAYQVAEAVGIDNPHYFGICFKKFTGVSVSDFKKAEI